MSRNKEIVKAFRAAQTLLATSADIRPKEYLEKHEFICNALGQAGKNGLEVDAATNVIQQRIAPHKTLNAWVVNTVLGNQWELCGRHAMQDYRHRWLDELIREFSTKK